MIQSVEEAVQKAEHRYLSALQRGGKWYSKLHSFISEGLCFIRVPVVTAAPQTLTEEQHTFITNLLDQPQIQEKGSKMRFDDTRTAV